MSENENEVKQNTSLADLIEVTPDTSAEKKNDETVPVQPSIAATQDEQAQDETQQDNETAIPEEEKTEDIGVNETVTAPDDGSTPDATPMDTAAETNAVEPAFADPSADDVDQIDKTDDKLPKGRIILMNRGSLKLLKRSRGFMLGSAEGE